MEKKYQYKIKKKGMVCKKLSKSDFIELIGNNKTDPMVVCIKDEEKEVYYGIYTHKKGVYILHDGCDSPLESFSEDIIGELYNKIKDGEFEIDPSYQ